VEGYFGVERECMGTAGLWKALFATCVCDAASDDGERWAGSIAIVLGHRSELMSTIHFPGSSTCRWRPPWESAVKVLCDYVLLEEMDVYTTRHLDLVHFVVRSCQEECRIPSLLDDPCLV